MIWLVSVGGFYQWWFGTLRISQHTELDRLMQIVHQADGFVLADEYTGLLSSYGRPIYIQPFELT